MVSNKYALSVQQVATQDRHGTQNRNQQFFGTDATAVHPTIGAGQVGQLGFQS